LSHENEFIKEILEISKLPFYFHRIS